MQSWFIFLISEILIEHFFQTCSNVYKLCAIAIAKVKKHFFDTFPMSVIVTNSFFPFNELFGVSNISEINKNDSTFTSVTIVPGSARDGQFEKQRVNYIIIMICNKFYI
jgi:hypothetical protein